MGDAMWLMISGLALADCVPAPFELVPADGAVDVPWDAHQLIYPSDRCIQSPLLVSVDDAEPVITPVPDATDVIRVHVPDLDPGEHELVISDATGLWERRVRRVVGDTPAPMPQPPTLALDQVSSSREGRNRYGWQVALAVDPAGLHAYDLVGLEYIFDGVQTLRTDTDAAVIIEQAEHGSSDLGVPAARFGMGTLGDRPLDQACVRVEVTSISGEVASEEQCEAAVVSDERGCSTVGAVGASWGLLALVGVAARRRRSL